MTFQEESSERVFILRKETQPLLMNSKQDMRAKFSDVRFLSTLLFLMDIFEFVNSVNLALKGREMTVLHYHKELTAFKMKLKVWDSAGEEELIFILYIYYIIIYIYYTYIDENELNVDDDIIELMKRHVSILREEIAHYFLDLEAFE